jgi:hypothetical protein
MGAFEICIFVYESCRWLGNTRVKDWGPARLLAEREDAIGIRILEKKKMSDVVIPASGR